MRQNKNCGLQEKSGLYVQHVIVLKKLIETNCFPFILKIT